MLAYVIRIFPYDPAWPTAFESEARRVRARFGKRALRIDHVGSTAVPGLAAKPVIDIQVSVATLAARVAIDGDMAALGYTHVDLGAFDRVYPFFVIPAEWPATHHVHLCEAGGEQERKHLAFRDYLRAHAEIAAEYVALKRALAREHGGATMAERERYSLAKGEFVRSVLERALAEGLPRLTPSDG